MNIKNIMYCILLLITGYIIASPAFADRQTFFNNDSDHIIRFWGEVCRIQQDGSQDCTEPAFIGLMKPHQQFTLPEYLQSKSKQSWSLAGAVITRVEIDTGVSSVYPNGVQTDFSICSDIHEDGIDGRLIIDFDSKAEKLTCKNVLVK